MNYWLIKSEPNVYSIEQMQQEKTCIWDGIRNYQARNFLRKMARGDFAFFYHSNTKYPGISGLVQVIESEIIDPTQFDVNSEYYDPKSTPVNPRWQTVRVKFVKKFTNIITLAQLKQAFTPDDLLLVRRGNRLSVMPVADEIADKILGMKTDKY
ncbi:MAG: EVE domain-containing protein [Limnoraphis sp. WC205]|jgi:predicted RNA-binding protein with PUA-like domain|nr:EVE domain-containing protein [Limnoraphis sp. WC205]